MRINGRIGDRRDLDHYAFAGVKGKAIRFEVHARFGTVLAIKSRFVPGHPRPRECCQQRRRRGQGLRPGFTPPADGDYVLGFAT